MATRPLHLDPPLKEAVIRARETLAAAGQLRPKPGRYRTSLDDQEGAAVAAILSDGTYRRLADAIASHDPDIAD